MIIATMLPEHWPSVRSIYQEGIDGKLSTFETSTPKWEQWDKVHLKTCRFIAIIDDTVVGWAALTPTSYREAYSGVVEVSVYVAQDFAGRAVGTSLLNEVIKTSEDNGLWTLQAVMFEENKTSIKLHEKCGFRYVGRREKIAQLHGEWKDTVIYERRSKII